MRLLAALGCFLLLVPAVSAEVFVLSGGGRVTGELLNPDESPRQQYQIQTEDGAKITLDASRVKKVLRPKPDEAEYERIAPTFADTAADQWKLAQWCQEHKLKTQRQAHLRRVIELDPDHAEARRLLGYSKVNGEWVTYGDTRKKQGYVLHNGKWMLPQEIEIADNKRKAEAVQQKWFKDLRTWRSWLGSDRDGVAREKLAGITDREAVPALARGLQNEKDSQTRLLYVTSLGKINAPEAGRTMAIASIYDGDEEIRTTCLDRLEEMRQPDVTSYFVGKLRDKNNAIVNLAAVALGRIKDPSAIGPLVEAVVTRHKFKIVKAGGDGGMSTSFGRGPNGGGTGMSMGGGPQYIHRDIHNQSVLDALVALTGRNFNFDKAAWKAWYASQRKAPDKLDARRDKK
jgi:hypothetical protein